MLCCQLTHNFLCPYTKLSIIFINYLMTNLPVPKATLNPKCLPPSDTRASPLIQDDVKFELEPASSYISLSIRSPRTLSDVSATTLLISLIHPNSVPSGVLRLALFVSWLFTASLACLIPPLVCVFNQSRLNQHLFFRGVNFASVEQVNSTLYPLLVV